MLNFTAIFKIHCAVKIGIDGDVIRLVQIYPLQIFTVGSAVGLSTVFDLQKPLIWLNGEKARHLVEKYAVVIGKEVLVDRRKAVKLAINAGFFLQLAQCGFLHALAKADASADRVIKRAFLVWISRHQYLSSAVDDHAHTVIEFSMLRHKCAVHITNSFDLLL